MTTNTTSTTQKFGEMEFTEEELIVLRKRLEEKIGIKDVSYRKGNDGGNVPYLETNKAILLANDIFGYTGWASQVVNLSVDYVDETSAGKFNAGVSAIVRVQLKDGTHHEDIGYGTADNQRSKAVALELAKKGAVSDGIKRALRCFGNALGNSMYDKTHMQNVKGTTPKAPLPTLNSKPLPQLNNNNNGNANNRSNFPQNNNNNNANNFSQGGNQFNPPSLQQNFNMNSNMNNVNNNANNINNNNNNNNNNINNMSNANNNLNNNNPNTFNQNSMNMQNNINNSNNSSNPINSNNANNINNNQQKIDFSNDPFLDDVYQ